MKVSLAILSVCVFAGLASASTNYSFTTTAAYSSGTGSTGGFCTSGDLCINFSDGTDPGTSDPLVIQLVYAPNNGGGVASTTDNFGSIQAFCKDNSTGLTNSNCQLISISGDLTINLTQITPASMTGGQFIDVLSGTISANSGIPTVNFGTTSFTYTDGSTYSLTYAMQQPVGGYDINNPSDPAATSFQGTVTDNGIPGDAPEPATLTMMGAGLLAVGFVNRRRQN